MDGTKPSVPLKADLRGGGHRNAAGFEVPSELSFRKSERKQG